MSAGLQLRELLSTMTHVLPDLPYPYDALEPYISRQIMELHHKKHHQTYVNALNAAETAYAKASTPKERIGLQAALKFNGGGMYALPAPITFLSLPCQATLTTLSSGRTLHHPQARERDPVVASDPVLSRMLSMLRSAVLKI